MKINDSNNPNTPDTPSAKPMFHDRGRGLFVGVVFLAAGLLWLLYGLDVVPERFFDALFSWQVLLMVIGGYLLTQRNWIGGGIVAGVGALFFVTDVLDVYVSFGRVVLPLILMVVGVAILCDRSWKAARRK